MDKVANYSGKWCTLLVTYYIFAINTNYASIVLWQNRKDFRHGAENTRSSLAKVNRDWESEEEFGNYFDACYLESAEYKTALNFYACYAQKP